MRTSGARHQQQQQQQQDQDDHHHQHDLDSLLGLVLGSLDTTEGQACACALHRTSRSSRRTAVATLKHLSLSGYNHGRARALYLVRDIGLGRVSRAAALAAAVPPLPGMLLADLVAARVLTSLDISASQAQHLLAGAHPTTAAAAVGIPGLATTLAGLRCLRVSDLMEEEAQLQQVGRLVGACSGLTQLVLATTERTDGRDSMLLEDALKLAAAPTAGEAGTLLEGAAAAGGAGPAEAAAAAASGPPVHWQLPHLQVLEVSGRFEGPLPPWMDYLEAPQLSRLHFERMGLMSADVYSLAACSGLRELVISFQEDFVLHFGDEDEDEALHAAFEGLTQLRALTKLVVECCELEELVPQSVWALTQLRHLDLARSWQQQQLAEDISCLKQLTYLGLQGARMWELPSDLGTWLPKLEVLVVAYTRVSAVPPMSTQLTKLDVQGCPMHSLCGVEHLTGLKELQLYAAWGVASWDALTKLSALEVLSLTIGGGAGVVMPGPLPRLRDLTLCAMDPVRRAAQLVGPGRHLTRLRLVDDSIARQQRMAAGNAAHEQDQDHAQAFEQLEVLPVLQALELVDDSMGVPALTSRWLQQQPQLTSLSLVLCSDREEVPQVWHLPRGLRELTLDGSLPLGGMPDLSGQLGSLHVLDLTIYVNYELPGWLSSLRCLEKVTAWAGEAVVLGWRVLEQLPLLRRFETKEMGSDVEDVLNARPHLCWAQQ